MWCNLSLENRLSSSVMERDLVFSEGMWSSSKPHGTWSYFLHPSLRSTRVIVIERSIKDAVNQKGAAITGQQAGHPEAVGL